MPIDNKEKVMIFIDGMNLMYSARAHGIKVNYRNLADILVNGRYLVRPYLYQGTDDDPERQDRDEKFFNTLRDFGFEVRTRPMKRLENGRVQEKGTDVELAIDMMLFGFRDHYDTAILVSGDQDFTRVAEVIKDIGKRIEVAAFASSISAEFRRKADSFLDLSTIIEDIKLSDFEPREDQEFAHGEQYNPSEDREY